MVHDNWGDVPDYCRACFMLSDPRESSPDHRPEGLLANWIVSRYLIRNVEAETHALQVRVEQLPLPSNLHLTNIVGIEMLSIGSIYELYCIVNQRLIPDFWLRVTRGENTSPASRLICLCLRQVLIINLALYYANSVLDISEWEIAMRGSVQILVH